MGHMTIALSDESEVKLRAFAREKFGSKKGAISKAVEELVGKTEAVEKRAKAIERLRQLMKKGFHLGGVAYKSRDELYDRKILSTD